MIRFILAYLGAGVSFAAIDAVWLTTMTDRFYKPLLGPLLAPEPDLKVAVIFYLVSIFGTVFLAVLPALKAGSWRRATLNGAVLGFVAYATYDLTNQATLVQWSTQLTIVDLCWGTVLTAVSATGGYFLARLAGPGRA
ncbi:MAG: putative membrane protein [Brevundimonas sp.]|jgi:uncharacterized membrane protein|uniref:DUF2177 family protein n=1 Tax=Brevundimonas sp. TaxID=1871086 RepID=UPI0039E66DDE